MGQRLREAALGVCTLQVVARPADGQVCIDIEGWRLTLLLDSEGLDRCLACRTPWNVHADLNDWPRYGTNPVDSLSVWERQRLEERLAKPFDG